MQIISTPGHIAGFVPKNKLTRNIKNGPIRCVFIPIFKDFIAETMKKMLNTNEFSELDAASMLKAAIPLFDKLLKIFVVNCNITYSVRGTHLLAKLKYEELMEVNEEESKKVHQKK